VRVQTMPKATHPVAVVTTVRVIRIVEVFPQAIPVFVEAKPGQWRRAA
jgi:hypothetical protein